MAKPCCEGEEEEEEGGVERLGGREREISIAAATPRAGASKRKL